VYSSEGAAAMVDSSYPESSRAQMKEGFDACAEQHGL